MLSNQRYRDNNAEHPVDERIDRNCHPDRRLASWAGLFDSHRGAKQESCPAHCLGGTAPALVTLEVATEDVATDQ